MEKEQKRPTREIFVDLYDEVDPRKLLREPTAEELMALISGSARIEFYHGNSLIPDVAHNRFYTENGQTHLSSFAKEYLTSRCVCFRGISERGAKVARTLLGESEKR